MMNNKNEYYIIHLTLRKFKCTLIQYLLKDIGERFLKDIGERFLKIFLVKMKIYLLTQMVN